MSDKRMTVEEIVHSLVERGITHGDDHRKDFEMDAVKDLLTFSSQQSAGLVAALEWYANDYNWDQNSGAARELIRQPNTVDGPGETIEEADMGYRAEKALATYYLTHPKNPK